MQLSDRGSVLEAIAKSLDISPTDFKTARERYLAVANWLDRGDYESGTTIDVYLQGSFRLGTVIRPFMNGQDADFDIDQVCEIGEGSPSARDLKHEVGDRLKAHGVYAGLLDAEGRRCWTLKYASTDGRPGFHLDVLPSAPADMTTGIRITDKAGDSYSWWPSNPRGYYRWFSEKNAMDTGIERRQLEAIFASSPSIYGSVDDVPRELTRTNLQRAIQVMKRHRDVCFNGRNGAPISIVITTICAHTCSGADVLDTIGAFTDYVTGRVAAVVRGDSPPIDGIMDYVNGKWFIANPAEPEENFANRWVDDPELAQNFVAWVYQLRRDADAFRDSGYPPDFGLGARAIQSDETSYGERLLTRFATGPIGSTDALLDLIHQGIDGRVPWPEVMEVAVRNVDLEDEGESRDVARVNFYQVKIHSRTGLTDEDRSNIRAILGRHSDSAPFVFCCNVLLGTATAAMLRTCVARYGAGALGWPITRLVAHQVASSSDVIVPARRQAFYGRGA